MNRISKVDICCGLAWGDEAKGKIVAQLSKEGGYDIRIASKILKTH